jgi:hypothetical protein|tara:strand:+ start:233 stop:637 length:405 start_codon:yes stop_codon:yes gene_type:complete
MSKALSLREAKALLKSDHTAKREAVEQELAAIGASELTDILSWDSSGRVTVLDSDKLPERTKRAIKKVKILPTQYGNQVEIEMHDKIAALRLLAKHYGMLNIDTSQNRPSVLGINIQGPETSYDIKEKKVKEES